MLILIRGKNVKRETYSIYMLIFRSKQVKIVRSRGQLFWDGERNINLGGQKTFK